MQINLEQLTWYTEVLRPFGWHHEQQIMLQLRNGAATFVINPGIHDSKTLSDEDGLTLLQLLVPAFRTGVELAVRAERRRWWLSAFLDQLDVAVCVFDHTGREEHRSAALSRQLQRDPARELVRQQIAAAAREMLDLLLQRTPSRWTPLTGRRSFATESCQYEASATPWPVSLDSEEPAVAVYLRWGSDSLPTINELMQHIGFTQRQAEVTRLLALGLSNDEIAERLGISRHTVRHHCEWVFLKLGVHSRKALALEIMRRVRTA